MAKQIIYWGEFRSVAGTLYRVEILSDDKSYTAQRVYFPYDTPIEIEWNEVDKLEPVQGACLTLSLVSKADRQFIDLYSIEVGKVRIDVYREGELYWSGTLDPELYEEPYSEKNDYNVSFSFSDFASLDRKRWEKTGICSIQEIIDTCLESSGINYAEIVKYISTSEYQYTDTVIDLNSINVLCENFYNEDGDAMTMREVLDETLRPFALHMVQKGGKIYLYDLNAVHADMATEEVYWDNTDARLGVDKVFNNVRVRFSPYSDSKLIDGTIEHNNTLNGANVNKFFIDTDWQNKIDGFDIAIGDQERLPLTLSNGAQFFRIDSIYSGDNEAGVIWACKGCNQSTYNAFLSQEMNFPRAINTAELSQSVPIITTNKAFIGYTTNNTSYKLRISLNVLFDVRYNPFEAESDTNESENWAKLQDWCNFGYIPVMLYLKDADGNILYHYQNRELMESDSYVRTSSNSRWVRGEGSWGDMYLAYYNWDNRESASGFGGWQTNKMMLGYYTGKLPRNWEIMDSGEYIELPPVAGFIELQVGRGVHQFDYKRDSKDIYSYMRWLLYKSPTVTLVNSNGSEISLNDIEDKAWINSSAKDDIEIETILGTMGDSYCPSSRGILFRGLNRVCDKFCRPKDTDGNKLLPRRLEHLLIGTIYSQYATRRNMLSGTVRLLPEMKVLTDASISGRYIMLSEVQRLMQDTSEIVMSEFVADYYDGIEYD